MSVIEKTIEPLLYLNNTFLKPTCSSVMIASIIGWSLLFKTAGLDSIVTVG